MTTFAYPEVTAITQVDPAASSHEGDAVESFPAPDLSQAQCAARADLEWTPDTEDTVVPAPHAELCHRCPIRSGCLAWAVDSRSVGYWAGTTTRDRETLACLAEAGAGAVSTQWADDLRGRELERIEQERCDDLATALHDPGAGNLRWYRRGGCRCSQCRAANAANRARERARAAAAA